LPLFGAMCRHLVGRRRGKEKKKRGKGGKGRGNKEAGCALFFSAFPERGGGKKSEKKRRGGMESTP